MKAIVIGHNGQDGTLLCNDLVKKNYSVLGFSSSKVYSSAGKLFSQVPSVSDYTSISKVVEEFQPDEIYYLAAYHASSEKAETKSLPEAFAVAEKVNVIGLLNTLSAIRDYSPNSKLFYASSSLVFSGVHGEMQDEHTPLSPVGFYGMTKAQAMWICNEFSDKYKVFASVGILYNHESYLRRKHFLSQKIVQATIRIASGSDEKIVLGDLSTRVDWSYAPDFIDAFQEILKLKNADTFIIASGEAHSVQEFLEIAFGHFNLDWRKYVEENNSILSRRSAVKIGNPQKLISKTGWKKSYSFSDFVKQLILDSQNIK